jgi:hypothetical protein
VAGEKAGGGPSGSGGGDVLCVECHAEAHAVIELPPLGWWDRVIWQPVCEACLPLFLPDTRVIDFAGA